VITNWSYIYLSTVYLLKQFFVITLLKFFYSTELLFKKARMQTTVDPLYNGHTRDLNLGFCREVGCFQRLSSIVLKKNSLYNDGSC